MILPIVLLTVGFILLIKGADLFVDGAARLALGMHFSPMAVGMTVVAFGTSTAELFVNIPASVVGGTDMALGNVVGSSIANILLILGMAALIRPLSVSKRTVWQAIPFSLLAVVMLWVLASDVYIDNAFYSVVSRSDGLTLLGFFLVFLAYICGVTRPMKGLPRISPPTPGKASLVALSTTIGFAGLMFGGRLVVDNAILLADRMAVPQAVVGLTVVALGTSLPELVTCVAAARQGNPEIAVGNVVGSNIFNVFFVLGVSAVIRPLPFNPAANVDMGVLTAASILLFIFLYTGRVRVMDREEGALAILIYLFYLGYLLLPVFSTSSPTGAGG
jgi:cation:H+ antiporter